MYFTTFYSGGKHEYSIIHEFEARPYADDMATYENYVVVNRQPTLEEAKIIFEVVKGNTLFAGISTAKTVKL